MKNLARTLFWVSCCILLSACGGGSGGAGSGETTGSGSAGATSGVPIARGLAPDSVAAGSGAFTLVVGGSGFRQDTVVRWNGANLPTTLVSSERLEAQVAFSDVIAAGTATITLMTPSVGSAPGDGLQFFILGAGGGGNGGGDTSPGILSISPESQLQNGPAFTLTVAGVNFLSDSVVRFGGDPRDTVFVSGNELRATINAADTTTAGCVPVTVTNPAPDGRTSNPVLLTIDGGVGSCNPSPVVADLLPRRIAPGSPAFTLSVTGSDFVSSSTINWNGTSLSTTFVSETRLDAVVPASVLTAEDNVAVTVFSPLPGGGTSAPQSFFVLAATKGLFFDTFDRADGEDIGNNWVEKTPLAFSVQGGEVLGTINDVLYRDNIVTRPLSEDRADLEIGLEFRRLPGPSNMSQIHARAQRSDLELTDTLTDYHLFVEEFTPPNGSLAIAIQRGVPGELNCFLAETLFPQALTLGDRYRLRFRVTGSDPVVLNGFLERFNGADWEVFVSASATHDASTTTSPELFCEPGAMPPPLTGAGAMGFSKWWTSSDALDNFYRIDL